MGSLRTLWLTVVSEIAWRMPGKPLRFVSSFRDTERGSCVDMLAAAELTDRRDLRRKYFIHAIDESRHANLFHSRAVALGGSRDRATAALTDARTLQYHGIIEGRPLFERYGELEFLAFVYTAEARAVEQFEVYRRRNLLDPDTDNVLERILKDEHFHVSYSRAELERYRRQGRDREVRAALWRVWWRRPWEAWMRFAMRTGHVVTGVWMTVLYALVVGPSRIFAKTEPVGWQPVKADPRPLLAAARSQA